MLQVNEIMTTDVLSVTRDTPIHEAVQLVIKNGISGLPVVDDELNLVGIVSERDMLNLYYNPVEFGAKTVNEFMTQPAVHFEETEDVSDVVEFFVKNIFRKIPITSNDKVVGMVSIVDVLKYSYDIFGEISEKDPQIQKA